MNADPNPRPRCSRGGCWSRPTWFIDTNRPPGRGHVCTDHMHTALLMLAPGEWARITPLPQETAMTTTRTEAFVELYDADTGWNLRHYRMTGEVGDPDDGHITGEACPCRPQRVTQSLTPEPIDGRADA